MAVDPGLLKRLQQGLRQMALPVTDEQRQKLCHYIALLEHWNKAYNLTAIRDPLEMVAKHLLDSLSIAPYLQGERILDMATGPGLPGIPLAILFPKRQFTLLDSNGKKIRFVRQAAMELGLDNIRAVQSRIEAFRPESGFDTLTARAFTALPRMVDLCRHLLTPDNRLLAMKGAPSDEELKQLAGMAVQFEVIGLEVPLLAGRRQLVIIELEKR